MDIDNNTEVSVPTSVAPAPLSEEERSIKTSTGNSNNMTVDTPTSQEIKATPSSPSKDNDAMDIEQDVVPTKDNDNKCPSPPPTQEDTTMDDVNNTNDVSAESNNNVLPQPPEAMETTTTTVPPKEEELVEESSTKRVKPSVKETKPALPLQENNMNIDKNDKVEKELDIVKEKEQQMKDLVVKDNNSSKVNLLADKKLGEDLDGALDRLLEVSI